MTLAALYAALAGEGGALAACLIAPEDGGRPPDGDRSADAPRLAASGPRATADPDEYELLLEMIVEGSLLHYGAPRLVRCEDPDLALLLGDRLYALGLARLAELGDLDAVEQLADVISLVAQAHAAGDPALAAAVWEAGAVAIGWGGDSELEAAKELARAGDARARSALHAARLRLLDGGSPPELGGGPA